MSKYEYKLSADGRHLMFGKKRNKNKMLLTGYELRVFMNMLRKEDTPQREAAFDNIYAALVKRADAAAYAEREQRMLERLVARVAKIKAFS